MLSMPEYYSSQLTGKSITCDPPPTVKKVRKQQERKKNKKPNFLALIQGTIMIVTRNKQKTARENGIIM